MHIWDFVFSKIYVLYLMNYFIKYKFLFFITLFLLLMFGYINFEKSNATFDEKLRNMLFDIRGEIKPTGQVVIVDIDEKSLKALGQWPFPRIHIAQVLANLANAKVGVVGLDIVFAEADRNSPHNMAKALGIEGEYRNNDALLGAVVAKTPTILGYFMSNDQSKNTLPKVATSIENKSAYGILEFNHLVNNINAISQNAYSSGFFNAFRDYHGKMTKIPLILQHNNRLYPSLALEMISATSETQKIKVLDEGGAIYGIQLKDFLIPTNEQGFMRINFRGASRSFQYLSFVDVLEGNFEAKDIEGKFVLIGTSAITLADIKATPFDLAMPGVEVHANIIDNILRGDFLEQPYYIRLIDMFILALTTLVLGYLLLKLSSLWGLVFVIVWSGLLSYALYSLHFEYGLVVNLLYPLLALIFSTLSAFYLNYTQEQEQKKFIKDKFSKKVSPQVANELLQSSSDTFATKEQVITMFFSDIRGFTTISEGCESPQKLIDLLNLYLEPMSEIITQHEGTIDKFIGDAIMAYWNAPIMISDHADCTVQSAIQQIEYLESLNDTINEQYDVTIEIGIGIHTGHVVVGEMGSSGRSDYTIIGDNVNLASRIEGLTKYFGCKILISQDTKEQLRQSYPLRYIAQVVVKGKQKPIALYEVMDTQRWKKFQAVEEEYNQAIDAYINSNYSQALKLFKSIEHHCPHLTHRLYIERLSNQAPIEQAFVMESK